MTPSEVIDLLSREAIKGIRSMHEGAYASHSFNLVFPACERRPKKSLTFWILRVPSGLDQAIYDALKPIIEERLGAGSLVEPNPRATKGEDS